MAKGAWYIFIPYDVDWVTLSNPTGNGNGTVTVTAPANTSSTTPRIDTLKFVEQGKTAVDVYIHQGVGTPIPISTEPGILPVQLDFSGSGGAQNLQVTATTSWTITGHGALDWISVYPNAGTGNALVTVTTLANPNVISPRDVTLLFTEQGGTPVNVEISQAAGRAASTSFKLFPTSRTFLGKGETLGVEVTSNAPWFLTIPSDANWVSASATSGAGNASLNITVAPNPSASAPRNTSITFEAEGMEPVTLPITQEVGEGIISVNLNRLDFSSKSGSQTLELTANQSWNAQSSHSWLRVSPNSGTESGTITVTVDPNTTVNMAVPRSGTITFTSSAGTRVVNVYQEASVIRKAISISSLGIKKDVNPDTPTAIHFIELVRDPFPDVTKFENDFSTYMEGKFGTNRLNWPFDMDDIDISKIFDDGGITFLEYFPTTITDEVLQELTSWYDPIGPLTVDLSVLSEEAITAAIDFSVEIKGGIGVIGGSATLSIGASKTTTTAQGLNVSSTFELTDYEQGKRYKVVLTATVHCWYLTCDQLPDPDEKIPFIEVDTSSVRVILVNND
jgi:hypothetical protein